MLFFVNVEVNDAVMRGTLKKRKKGKRKKEKRRGYRERSDLADPKKIKEHKPHNAWPFPL